MKDEKQSIAIHKGSMEKWHRNTTFMCLIIKWSGNYQVTKAAAGLKIYAQVFTRSKSKFFVADFQPN